MKLTPAPGASHVGIKASPLTKAIASRVDDFDMALPRVSALVDRLDEEPHVNPSTGTAEFSLRDPDGYYVTISALAAA